MQERSSVCRAQLETIISTSSWQDGETVPMGKRPSKNSSSFKISDHQQSLLFCYFQPVSLPDLGLKQPRHKNWHKENTVLGFLDIHGQHTDRICSFFFVFLCACKDETQAQVQFKTLSLKSSLEVTGKCLNKDSAESSRAQPQFLFHPEKGKSR